MLVGSKMRQPVLLLGLAVIAIQPLQVQSQILNAAYTPCLPDVEQAPWEQRINVSRVYAQLDTSTFPRSSNGGGDGQAILRLVASAETRAQSEGFSNITNYLATLITESSILSFAPYSNQTALCSSVLTAIGPNGQSGSSQSAFANLTAESYPSPGGCPYGPGPLLVGVNVPLGDLVSPSYWSLATIDVRIRILDTSYPPLQLSCVDVLVSPHYYDGLSTKPAAVQSSSSEGSYKTIQAPFGNDPSKKVFDTVLWLPVALFIAFLSLNIVARLYAATTTTRHEREAALASSLTAKISSPSWSERISEVVAETVIGRSIIRSRSLTRFVTPNVGDILCLLQWIVLVGMCAVQWEGFNYPLFARLAWSMLLFDTTIVAPAVFHPSPLNSTTDYPPKVYSYNTPNLFTTTSSPFFFSSAQPIANLLSLPSTTVYNQTNSSIFSVLPTALDAESHGIASLAVMLGLRPQDLFANCLTWFGVLLGITLLCTLFVPAFGLVLWDIIGGGQRGYRSTSSHSHRKQAAANHTLDSPVYATTHASPSTDYFRNHQHDRYRPNFAARGVSLEGASLDSSQMSKESGTPTAGPQMPRSPLAAVSKTRQLSYSNASEGVQSPSLPHHDSVGGNDQRSINRWWAVTSDKRGFSKSTNDGSGQETYHVSGAHANDKLSLSQSLSVWISFCQGSMVRLVFWFHLPITILSIYQLSHATSGSSTVTVVFAVIVFVLLSLLIPSYIVLRLRKTSLRYLQDDTRTLLAYGPLYNTYAQDSYTFVSARFTANIIEGVVVGSGQRRATIQVAIILAVEVVETLITSIWLPWAEGAAQGPLQFVLSVSRIITAVLLVVISPSVSINAVARAWICYVIVILQAVIVLLLALVVLVKAMELAVRIVTGTEFDESRNPKTGGLFGAFRRKRLLGFGRAGSIARGAKRKPKAGQRTLSMHNKYTDNHQEDTRSPHLPHTANEQMGYLTASDRYTRPTVDMANEEDDGQFIASAWRHDQYQASNPNNSHIQPGTYSAGTASTGFAKVRAGRATDAAPYTMQDSPLPPGAMAAYGPHYVKPTNANAVPLASAEVIPPATLRRGRAASQSAAIEQYEDEDGEISPTQTAPLARDRQSQVLNGHFATLPVNTTDSRRLSAPMPSSPTLPSARSRTRPTSSGAALGWRRENSTASAFFSNLFKGPAKSQEGDVDEWTDSSDDEAGSSHQPSHSKLWPFNRLKTKRSQAEALALSAVQADGPRHHRYRDENEAWEEEAGQNDNAGEHDADIEASQTSLPPTKSFVVVRQPRQGAARTSSVI